MYEDERQMDYRIIREELRRATRAMDVATESARNLAAGPQDAETATILTACAFGAMGPETALQVLDDILGAD